jgi:hypothetical protein
MQIIGRESSYYKVSINGQMKKLSKLPLVKPRRTQRHQVIKIRRVSKKDEHGYKGSNYRSI